MKTKELVKKITLREQFEKGMEKFLAKMARKGIKYELPSLNGNEVCVLHG